MPSRQNSDPAADIAVPTVPNDAAFYGACLLMFAGLVLGGIQSPYPLFHFSIEALTVVYLVIVAMQNAPYRIPRTQLAMAILIAAIPVAQLIPLPHALWTALPGRALIVRSDEVTGLGAVWRPLTLSVAGTVRSLIGLLPPLAVFLTVPRFGHQRRDLLILVVLIAAACSLLMSAVQLGSPPGAFRFYRGGHDLVPVGIFANRNHEANFMLVCLPLSAAMLRNYLRSGDVAQVSLWVLAVLAFSGGVLATNSRTGLALLPVAIAGAAWVFFRGNPAASLIRRSRVLKAALATIAIGLVGFIIASAAGLRTLARFGDLGDLRFDYWPQVIYLIGAHLPFGSGLGTFDQIFRSAEDLNVVSDTYFNHAHNDYLEIALETGIPGLLILLVALAVLGRAMWRISARRHPVELAAGVAILLMIAHSLLDYPLRTYTLSMTFALCAAVLLNPRAPSSNGASAPRRNPKKGWL